jgi:hypothetical protein
MEYNNQLHSFKITILYFVFRSCLQAIWNLRTNISKLELNILSDFSSKMASEVKLKNSDRFVIFSYYDREPIGPYDVAGGSKRDEQIPWVRIDNLHVRLKFLI